MNAKIFTAVALTSYDKETHKALISRNHRPQLQDHTIPKCEVRLLLLKVLPRLVSCTTQKVTRGRLLVHVSITLCLQLSDSKITQTLMISFLSFFLHHDSPYIIDTASCSLAFLSSSPSIKVAFSSNPHFNRRDLIAVLQRLASFQLLR